MTITETITTALAESTADLLGLESGLIWHCDACPMESYRIYETTTGARHDAVGHALLHHQNELPELNVGLQAVGSGDRDLRQERRRVAAWQPGDPEIELAWPHHTPLSLADEVGCDLIGCPPDAAHRARW